MRFIVRTDGAGETARKAMLTILALFIMVRLKISDCITYINDTSNTSFEAEEMRNK